jgi:predicted negative regulator of RcsB-dependent stress response
MTFNTHMVAMAIAGLGISAAVAVLVALAIVGVFAWYQHDKAQAKPVTVKSMQHEQLTQTQLRQAA